MLPARALAASALTAVAILAAVTGYGLSRHTSAVAALVVGAVAVLVIPPRWLPALGLALFALLPVGYLPVPYTLVYLPPASLTLIVWLARRRYVPTESHAPTARSRVLRVLAPESCLYLFASWCLVTTLLSVDKRSSIEWTLAFTTGVVIFARSASRDSGVLTHLRNTWIALGAALGVYALIEVEALHTNPLFGRFYATSSGNAFSQYTTWSTYRATTTLGHPLLNSTFFSAAAGLSLGTYLQTGRRWPLLAGALASAGVLVTLSRSGLLALGAAVIGASLVSLFDPASRRRATRSLVLIGVLVIAAGTTLAAGTLRRSASHEGSNSTAARTSLFNQGQRSRGSGLSPVSGPGR